MLQEAQKLLGRMLTPPGTPRRQRQDATPIGADVDVTTTGADVETPRGATSSADARAVKDVIRNAIVAIVAVVAFALAAIAQLSSSIAVPWQRRRRRFRCRQRCPSRHCTDSSIVVVAPLAVVSTQRF